MEFIGNLSTSESPITGATSALQNAGNTPSIQAEVLANLPPAGTTGRIFIASDTGQIYRDTGSTWVLIGSGAIAGSSTQVQINFNGQLYADTSFTYDPATDTLGLNGTNTSIVLNGISVEPPSSPVGTGRFYAKAVADRVVPKWVGAAGVDYILQPHFGGNNIRSWRGGATTTATTFASTIGTMPYTGASPTTPTIPSLASTNLLSQTRRSTIATNNTNGSIAYIRANQTEVWRGNASNLGGFFIIIRFALSGTLRTGLRAFAGIVDTVANPTNINPLTTTTPGGIGLACAASTGNWSLVHNISGTARTALDLGSSFPIDNTSLMELVLFSPPNGSAISWRVTNLSTGAQDSGTVLTNIPSNTTFLSPSIWVTNNTSGASQALDFVSCYVETDF